MLSFATRGARRALSTRARRRALICGSAVALMTALTHQSAMAATPASAYDVTFIGGNVSGSAVITVNAPDASGNQTVNYVLGSVLDTDISAAPGAVSGPILFDYADNKIYPNSPQLLSNGGLSFTSAALGSDFNLYSDGTIYNVDVSNTNPYTTYQLTTFTLTPHAAVDSSQPFFTQTDTPLTLSTVVFSGGTFKPTGDYGLTAPVILNYNGGTVDTSNGLAEFDGNIQGPGGLTITGAHGAIITGADTATGATTIDSGSFLQIGIGTGAGSVSGDIVDSGALYYNETVAQSLTGVISGSGTLEVRQGTLQLTRAETFTGLTTIDKSATLQLWGSGSIAHSIDPVVNGTFDISLASATVSVDSLSGANTGHVILGSNTLKLTAAQDTFAGQITGNGGLEVAGGTETLTGVNTYSGLTTIDGTAKLVLSGSGSISNSGVFDDGTLDISGVTGATASIKGLNGSGAVTLGGKTLVLTNPTSPNYYYFTGVISGSGGLEVAGGYEYLKGANTYTGQTTIDHSAALGLWYSSATIATSSRVVDNGAFEVFGGASIKSLAGSGSVGLVSGSLKLTDANDTFTGVISGIGNGLEISGGTETLAGANTYTGATTIDHGATLKLSGSGSIADSSGVTDNGTFDISGVTGASASIQGLGGSGGVTLGSKTLVLTAPAYPYYYLTGVIQGSGGLEVAGGLEYLGGANTYTGQTTIDHSAVLSLWDGGSIADSSGVVDNGALWVYEFGGTTSIKTLSGSGSVVLGSGALKLTTANGAFSGVISGTGSLEIGGGTETLTGVNTYTGATTIDIGATLKLSNGGSIAHSSVADDGTFDITAASGAVSVVSLSGSGTVKLGSNTLVLTNASGTFSGSFSGQGVGGVTIHGGTETVTGVNFLTGAVTIDHGATLQWGDGTNDGLLVGGGGGAYAVTDNGALIANFGPNNFWGEPFAISGSGSLEVKSGILGSDGISTYTGKTTIDPGAQLELAFGGSIADSSGVHDDGTFDISGNGPTSIKSLSGSGSVKLGSGTLTLTNAGGTFSGVIADGGDFGGIDGHLTIAGGTEILTGTNTYNGGTTIDHGATLQLGGGGSTGTVVGGITDNGALVFDYGTDHTFTAKITGSGSVEVNTAGAGAFDAGLYLTNANSYTGGTTVDAGSVLLLGNGGTTGSITGDVVTNGDLVFDRSDNVTFGGLISGDGWITVAGGGTVTLTNDDTFLSYPVIFAGSTLQLGNGGTKGSVASNYIDDDGALVFNHSNAITYSGEIFGSGSVTVAGSDDVFLTGNNVYTGGTTIDAGAGLVLGNGGTTGSVVGNVVDNGLLEFDRSNTTTFAGNISGAGVLFQVGTGTTILNGNNTVTGFAYVGNGVLEVGDAGHTGAVLDSHLVIVDTNGTLMGHGTIAGAVTNTAGGVVAPGGTIGTLTVGSYSQGATSTLAIEVAPTAASELNSLGAASLAGTLALSFDAGTYGPHIYEIVAGSPVSGTFSTVTMAGLPTGVVAGLTYASGQVDLVAEPTVYATAYGGLTTATLNRAQSFASLVEDSFGDAACADGSTPKPKAGATDACHGMRAWAQVIGSTDHVGAVSGGAGIGFNNKGAGFIGGLDKRWDDGATLGAAFGYADNSFAMNGAFSNASGRSFFGSLYGRWSQGPVQLDGQGYYMKTDWPLRRLVGTYGVARSNPDGDSFGFLAQASTEIGDSGLHPYLRFGYSHFDRDATTETGVGPLGYDVLAGSAVSSLGEAGLIYQPTNVQLSGHPVLPSLRVGVQQEFANRNVAVSASLVGVSGTNFTVDYLRPERTTGVADASVKIGLTPSFELTGEVRGRFGSQQSEGVASVGGAFKF